MQTADVLSAKRWADLGLPHDKTGLRQAQRLMHPDVNHDPDAGTAFQRLFELFNAPELDLRLAKGTMNGGSVIWTFDAADADLAEVALSAHRSIRNHKSMWAAEATLSADRTELTCGYGDGWWWLSDFGTLDERTVVWVAKRLMALAAIADNCDLVHGDINPSTTVLMPSEHGLRLDGWWTCVRVGEPLSVRPAAPTLARFTKGAPATPELMVSQAAKMLLGHDTGPLTDVLNDLWLRPINPNLAFFAIDAAAVKAFGKASWHPLHAPSAKGI